MTTKRYAVTIHDVGNICDDPRNVHTILTSTDRIQPRERVEVEPMTDEPATMADHLAALVEHLTELSDHRTPCPVREQLADRLRGRTFTAPRGVTFTTPAEGEGSPLYVENKHGRIWSEENNTARDGLTQQNLTVYGTLTRGEKVTRGSVDVWYNPNAETGPEQYRQPRAYFRALTGAAVPDGARENVAALVLADLGAIDWPALAVETERAERAARISRHLSEAARSVADAARALAVADSDDMNAPA